MELNEVKIGDTVSFTHKGKKVTGKVIYRHDGNKNAALAGHINIQPMDADSRPHTIHVSKTRPATQIKEDIQMSDINEAILDLIDNIDAGNHVEANSIFSSLLQHKIDALLDVKKAEVSSSMFNTNECTDCEAEEVDEALVGNQHKIDANKNGKVDGHDFKLLRKKKGMKEEVEDLDELSKQTLSAYIKKAGPQITGLRQKHGLTSKPAMKRSRGVTRASINYLKKDLADLRKEEAEQTQEAYSDPYAAKKSAEMKKAHAATMADAKKEYDAAKKPKFAKNFMKMKKEEVEIEEGNAENKMKKNAYADAKGAANKNGVLDRGSQRRVDSRRTDEVDSIKKGIDNYAPKKAPVRNIIRGKVFGKLSDTETKMFAKKRVKEENEIQELDKSTMISYLQKRHFQGKKTTPKQEKGRMNALDAIDTKNHGKKRSDKEKAASSMSGAQADYKKGTYSGD